MLRKEYGSKIYSGFDGYILCLEERQKRALDYLEKSKMHSVIIKNVHRNWKQAYERIADNVI